MLCLWSHSRSTKSLSSSNYDNATPLTADSFFLLASTRVKFNYSDSGKWKFLLNNTFSWRKLSFRKKRENIPLTTRKLLSTKNRKEKVFINVFHLLHWKFFQPRRNFFLAMMSKVEGALKMFGSTHFVWFALGETLVASYWWLTFSVWWNPVRKMSFPIENWKVCSGLKAFDALRKEISRAPNFSRNEMESWSSNIWDKNAKRETLVRAAIKIQSSSMEILFYSFVFIPDSDRTKHLVTRHLFFYKSN